MTVYTPDGEIDRKEANGKPEIFTWNIYGGVKSVDETFGDLDEYVLNPAVVLFINTTPIHMIAKNRSKLSG